MTRCVIFDVDGTLFDTGEGIRGCVRRALDDLGAVFPDDKLNLFIGPSLFYCFNVIAGLPEADANRAVEIYRSYYHTYGIDMSHPYDGIFELLDRLKKEGYILTVASSKPIKMVKYLFDKHDMNKYFDEIAAADFTTVSCDKADFVRKASLGEQNIVVGDTRFDIEGAHKAGVHVIAAAYGFGERDTLAAADYTADSVQEVYDRICDAFSVNK